VTPVDANARERVREFIEADFAGAAAR
jgi:hypothetical protein